MVENSLEIFITLPLQLRTMTYKLGIFFLFIGFIACKEAPQRPTQILEEGYQPTDPAPAISNTGITPPAAPGAEPPQNAQGVWHYTCPNGCAGGAGGASPCAGCGTTLVHNQAYHGGGATTTTSPVIANPGPGGKGSITNPVIKSPGTANIQPISATTAAGTPAAAAPEPPQNADGVWHYTCPNGCAGGAGSATACAGCGTTLAHNQGYH